MMLFRLLPLLLSLFASQLAVARDVQGRTYTERPEVQAFMAEMQERNAMPQAWLARLFDGADFKPAVIKAILPPASPQVRSWRAYRSRFVEPKRIAAGLKFWQSYAPLIKAASEMYGVPEEIIVSIIGVETIYGKHTGQFETFSALTTLAFDYPPRAPLFRRELEALLLLAREENHDPRSYTGSYAGALGLPQFLPSSIRKYAVDFDHDGDIDLLTPADAIGSVASFLHEHGWVSGGPVAVPAQITDEAASGLVARGIEPALLPSAMQAMGLSAPNAPEEPAALIDLVTPSEGTEYWLGYRNFYVITRYNRSSFYAMAVYQLAEKLKETHRQPAGL